MTFPGLLRGYFGPGLPVHGGRNGCLHDDTLETWKTPEKVGNSWTSWAVYTPQSWWRDRGPSGWDSCGICYTQNKYRLWSIWQRIGPDLILSCIQSCASLWASDTRVSRRICGWRDLIKFATVHPSLQTCSDSSVGVVGYHGGGHARFG